MHNNNIELIEGLTQILGADQLSLDLERRTLLSTDLSFRPNSIALAVIHPTDIDSLSSAVTAVAKAGCSVLARGGGMSYTSGYTPANDNSVLVDMAGLDAIVEINREDMYVTVQCGCSWKKLHEALQPLGLRTPYSGPLSGAYATVGGALSQNSLFHGSGVHHTAAESVLGLKVVLADGSVLVTGSGAHKHAKPFYRHFGPDVTGLFTADTGAFGIKAEATLRLLTAPRHTGYLSYKFETLENMLQAQVDIARLGIASECYGFDPYYNNGFEKQGFTFEEGLSLVGKIARRGGLKNAARVALSGKKLLKDVPYSLHMTLDGHTEAVAAEHVDLAADICSRAGGTEMANSIPLAFRSEPFGGVRTVLLGSDGELWLPVHGFFPLSQAIEAAQATEQFLQRAAPTLEKYQIKTSYLTCFSGAEFVIEPSFYWRDQLGEFRLSLIEPEFANKWRDIPEDLHTRQVVLDLRDQLRDLFDSLGAMHLQIGKYYPFLSMMNHPTLPRVIREIKKVLDPQGRMNPGSLGLD